jgi:recombination protein RecT
MAQTQTQNKSLTVPLRQMLSQDNIKKRFSEVLGERRGAQFSSSLLSVVNGSKQLSKCKPETIISAAAQAAALDLSILPAIGQAAVVPYGDEAGFQLMVRGVVQLAIRSKKYEKIVIAEVYEGQLKKWDRFKREIELDEEGKKSDKVVGFYFYFRLLSGQVHQNYWTVQDCVNHGWKFSKSFRLYGSGLWMDDSVMPTKGTGKNLRADIKKFPGYCTMNSGLFRMCAKTVVKNEINRWGPMSSIMEEAFASDQAVIREDGTRDYVDTTAEPTPEPQSIPEPEAADKTPDDTPPPPVENEQFIETFKLSRVARTSVDERPVEVATREDMKGDDAKYYTDNEGIATAMRNAGKSKSPVKIVSEVRGGRKWIMTISPAD